MSSDEEDFESIVTPALWDAIEDAASRPAQEIPGLKDFMETNVQGGRLDGMAYTGSPNLSADDARKLAEQAFDMLHSPEQHEAQTRCPDCGSTTKVTVSGMEFLDSTWRCSCGRVWKTVES